MREQNILTVTEGSVTFGDKSILQDISLAAGGGEFIGIVGPNGAGKSTLLRALRGLIPLVTGEVRLFGRPVRELGDKEIARQIAYMQQDVNVRFGFTALEVVLAGRYPYLNWWSNESDEDYRIARKYMAFTGVEQLADRPVQQVSGGERQRILLAKVLAQETPLIFLDEPTANLDLTYQEEVFRYCRTLAGQGKLVLLVAHDLKMAAKFCSRLILLAGGRVVADGAPVEVITEENLSEAYGLHSAVFTNKITGQLDIHTYEGAATSLRPQLHIIGGGGSACDILRLLRENSFPVTGGVFHEGDSDADACEAFDMDCVLAKPFTVISNEQGEANRRKIVGADWTIVTNTYWGEQNLDNLQAAFAAEQLILLEDTPVETRDYTAGRATDLYRELCGLPGTVVMTTDSFAAAIAAEELFRKKVRGKEG